MFETVIILTVVIAIILAASMHIPSGIEKHEMTSSPTFDNLAVACAMSVARRPSNGP